MIRTAAAAMFAVFLGLVVTDAFECSDGCRSLSSTQAADARDATSMCPLCSGAMVPALPAVRLTALHTIRWEQHMPVPVASSESPARSIDHPPRPA